MKSKRPRHSNKRRLPIYARDGKNCFYCGTPTVEHNDPSGAQLFDQATLDHFYPQSQIDAASWRSPKNFVIACYACNHEKGDKDPVEFFIEKQLYLRYVLMQTFRKKYAHSHVTRNRRRNRPSDHLPQSD